VISYPLKMKRILKSICGVDMETYKISPRNLIRLLRNEPAEINIYIDSGYYESREVKMSDD
jgi:hypothetical protein